MIIKTERLTLRPFKLSDLDSTHAYAGDPTNTEYMLHLPNRSKDGSERFLRWAIEEWKNDEQRVYEFAIILSGEHIGAVSMGLKDDKKTGEIGWIICRDYQGKGFATEAAKAIMDYAFDWLEVEKVVAHCDYRNAASVRIMEKIGMILERDDLMRRYKNSDEDMQELMYSIRKPTYLQWPTSLADS